MIQKKERDMIALFIYKWEEMGEGGRIRTEFTCEKISSSSWERSS